MPLSNPWTNCITGILLGLLLSHYSTSLPSIEIVQSKQATTMASSLKVGDTFPEGVEFSYALCMFKKAACKRLPIAANKSIIATSHTTRRRKISKPVELPQLTVPARSLRIRRSSYSPFQVGHDILS